MSPLSTLRPATDSAPASLGAPARAPEEAARQFEAVLVRQFVDVMTRDLFKASGDGAMAAGQADLQRDTLTNVLTDHLVESGTFGIADLLMRQWARTGRLPDDVLAEAAAAVPATPTVPAAPDLAPVAETTSAEAPGPPFLP